MKNLRVLFMGTPDFAVHILDHLVTANCNIVGVVTTPDKPAGRGQRMHASAVKKYAKKKELSIYQPPNLKSDEFQKDLKKINPDVAVVVAFRMLPEKVWAFPKLGTFNLHASLLPDYRGAAPINWAIINGETKTGVTTFFLDEKIDTGRIIKQEEVAITPKDTAGSLHDKLMETGAHLVHKTLLDIAKDNINPQTQPQETAFKPAPKLHKKNTQIDWSKPIEEIHNFIRGLNPYPVAWTYFENGKEKLRCKLYETEVILEEHTHEIGKVIQSKTELKVAVKSGFISIKKMQLPGKRKMPIKNLLNGLHLNENAKMR